MPGLPSQRFIAQVRTPHLDGDSTLFGQVVSRVGTLDRLARRLMLSGASAAAAPPAQAACRDASLDRRLAWECAVIC